MVKKFEEFNMKNYKFDCKTIFCKYLWLFLIGSFVGYIYEIIFFLVDDHVLVNRGFLYGPYLPVYGFGAIILAFLLKRFKKNPLVVFLLAMLITGVLEYFTGCLLWNIYHKTWWDYTGLFLNIDGYVCLRSVLSFGIGGLLLIYLVEPFTCKFLAGSGKKKLCVISILLIIVIILDLVFTVIFRY